jgi:hypothetical protein
MASEHTKDEILSCAFFAAVKKGFVHDEQRFQMLVTQDGTIWGAEKIILSNEFAIALGYDIAAAVTWMQTQPLIDFLDQFLNNGDYNSWRAQSEHKPHSVNTNPKNK